MFSKPYNETNNAVTTLSTLELWVEASDTMHVHASGMLFFTIKKWEESRNSEVCTDF